MLLSKWWVLMITWAKIGFYDDIPFSVYSKTCMISTALEALMNCWIWYWFLNATKVFPLFLIGIKPLNPVCSSFALNGRNTASRKENVWKSMTYDGTDLIVYWFRPTSPSLIGLYALVDWSTYVVTNPCRNTTACLVNYSNCVSKVFIYTFLNLLFFLPFPSSP